MEVVDQVELRVVVHKLNLHCQVVLVVVVLDMDMDLRIQVVQEMHHQTQITQQFKDMLAVVVVLLTATPRAVAAAMRAKAAAGSNRNPAARVEVPSTTCSRSSTSPPALSRTSEKRSRRSRA